MKSNIYQSEVVHLESLNHLFIELTAKNCNQHCKHCYIDFPKYKKEIDYISIDTIKQALNEIAGENIHCIYLTGAEPMTHPDFNTILRLCLKDHNVCICTNGSFINEKKARFLKKVEEESDNEIIFKLSLDHFDEIKNDDLRYRGAFRHTVFAIKHLLKYDFQPYINVVNYYNIQKSELIEGFLKLFKRNDFNIGTTNINIIPWHDKNAKFEEENLNQINTQILDCKSSRTLTASGVYTCPFLANDYRGRCGSNFADYNKKSSLETSFCNTCIKSDKHLFAIDFN